MLTVAILGAGPLGGALARTLAGRDVAREIRLIDDAAGVAAGKALDIRQSGPVERFDTALTGGSELPAARGAGVLIVADRHGEGGEWHGDAGLALVRRAIDHAPDAPIVFAGAGHRGLMTLALVELRLPRARLVGSAPHAAASAARALVALELNGSPRDVSLSVAGAPPAWVIGWTAATWAGDALAPLLAGETRVRVFRRLEASWPPGPYALASAAADVVAAMAAGSRRRFPVFVGLDGELQRRRTVVALPATLGRRGVEAVHVPDLSPRERVDLETAIER